jgi:hypothetical protein
MSSSVSVGKWSVSINFPKLSMHAMVGVYTAYKDSRDGWGELTMQFGIIFDTHVDKWDLIRLRGGVGL